MSLVLDDFKNTKRQHKQYINDISDIFDDVLDQTDVGRKEKIVTGLKSKMGQAEKSLTEMEQFWAMLDPHEKAQYRNKMTKFRADYENMRKKYFKINDSVQGEQNRLKLEQKSTMKDEQERDMRKKLLDGTENLYGQSKQLENTKKMGLETNEYIRLANRDLRDQRDILISVGDKNAQIRVDLERGNKIITEMSMREYLYRVAIHFTAFLLLMAILICILHNLVK
ncbi:vesicle transport through interaction with t-snares-like protein 1a [Stylonychia lemnae]|uniref:Vesicle transport through interaction with t-snares-like protein 1a n=1 Tax=Stylonychia lemnae TaxID=5949 RepID=A0A078AIY4_STYLE|nr:vesicle transport through interaction with t-snares-like protein 1a [Stylonychia lemnae]|eukprot:CDW82184.1 vesicle transport through interaction with t-snares-like protein 1a [Stylonychia lemnae]